MYNITILYMDIEVRNKQPNEKKISNTFLLFLNFLISFENNHFEVYLNIETV